MAGSQKKALKPSCQTRPRSSHLRRSPMSWDTFWTSRALPPWLTPSAPSMSRTGPSRSRIWRRMSVPATWTSFFSPGTRCSARSESASCMGRRHFWNGWNPFFAGGEMNARFSKTGSVSPCRDALEIRGRNTEHRRSHGTCRGLPIPSLRRLFRHPGAREET